MSMRANLELVVVKLIVVVLSEEDGDLVTSHVQGGIHSVRKSLPYGES